MSCLPLLNYYRITLLRLPVSDDPLIAAIYADAQTRLKEPRHLDSCVSQPAEEMCGWWMDIQWICRLVLLR